MAIPKYNEFMKPILEYLHNGRQHTRVEMYKYMADKFSLTDEELELMLPQGNQLVYKNRIGWALTYLFKANLVDRPKRSVYQITELGKKVLEENLSDIDVRYLTKFDGFVDFISLSNSTKINKNKKIVTENNDSPQDLMDKAYETISKSLIDEILQEIMGQTPDFFENLVVKVLVSLGYGGNEIENTKILGKTGDEGIDGIIKEDKLGFDEIYVQAKRWDVNTSIGRPEIQKFMGALAGQGGTKGAFITTAKFTKEAKKIYRETACYKNCVDRWCYACRYYD